MQTPQESGPNAYLTMTIHGYKTLDLVKADATGRNGERKGGNWAEFSLHCSLIYDLVSGRGCQRLLICGSLTLPSPRPQHPNCYDDDDDDNDDDNDDDDIRQESLAYTRITSGKRGQACWNTTNTHL